MIAWLTKFRISSALDADSPASPLKRQTGGFRPEEIRRFEEAMQTLDRDLRNRPRDLEPPPDLHASIMTAVRATREANSAVALRSASGFRWLPVPALAGVMLLGLWWALHRPITTPVRPAVTDQVSLLGIGSALELGGNAARALPPNVVAPLSEELGHVNLDLENTARFLLTSLP